MKTRRIVAPGAPRRAALGILALSMAASSVATAQPVTNPNSGKPAGVYAWQIDPAKINHVRTREQWDTLVTRGVVNLYGQRIQAWSTGNARWEYSDGTNPPVWTALVAAAGVTLDSAHQAGATITVNGTDTAVTINNTTTNGTDNLDLTASGIVAGAVSQNVLSVVQSAANTTTGTVRLANFNFSGTVAAGTPEGIRITVPANTNNAIIIPTGAVTLTDGALTLTSGNFTMSSGNATLTAGDLTLSNGQFVLTDTANEDVSTWTANTVSTNQVLTMTANGLTSGDLILGESSAAGITTGNFLRLNNGAADVYSVELADGTTTIGGTASGTDALVVTAGDLLLSSGNADLTSGNLTVTAGDVTMSAGLLTVVPTNTGTRAMLLTLAGARTVSAIEANVTGAATAANGVFLDLNASAAFTTPLIDIDASGAHTGNVLDVTTSSTGSGNLVDLNVGAAAYTGDAVNIALGATATGAQAIVVTAGAAARANELVYLEDLSTSGAARTLRVATETTDAASLAITVEDPLAGSAFGGIAYNADLTNADVGAGGIFIESGSRAFTRSLLTLNATGAGGAVAEPFLEINVRAAGAATTDADAIQVNVGADDYRGYALDAKLGATATLSGVVEATAGAAARTADLYTTDDDGTNAGDVYAVAKSAGTGDIANYTFDGAGTGDGIDLNMASNVAGVGIKLASAATTGSAMTITHTGALASAGAIQRVVQITSTGAWDADATNPTFLLDVDQNTGAGAAGDFAVRINASGANVEALHVDAGTTTFDETVNIGVAGSGPGGVGLNVEAAPGSVALDIDATTAGQRPTHTNGVLRVQTSSLTANAASVNIVHTMTGDVDGQAGIIVQPTTPAAFLTGTNELAGVAVITTGQNNAGETGVVKNFISSFQTFNAATTLIGYHVDGAHDFTVATEDTGMVIRPRRVTNAVGDTASFGAGQGLGAGNGGGALTVHGGDGASATTGGAGGATTVRGGNANGDSTVDRNGGTLNLWGGNAVTAGAAVSGSVDIRTGTTGTTDGTISLGIAGTTNRVLLTVPSAAGFGGINTVAASGTMRPTRVDWIQVGSLVPITGCTAGVFGAVGTKDMADAALNECSFSYGLKSDVDDTGTLVVGIVWTSEAGADGSVAVWDVEYSCIADNAQTDTAYTSIGATNDTLTTSDESERVEFTIPAAAFASADICHINVQRQGADANDTVGQVVEITDIYVRYTSLTP